MGHSKVFLTGALSLIQDAKWTSQRNETCSYLNFHLPPKSSFLPILEKKSLYSWAFPFPSIKKHRQLAQQQPLKYGRLLVSSLPKVAVPRPTTHHWEAFSNKFSPINSNIVTFLACLHIAKGNPDDGFRKYISTIMHKKWKCQSQMFKNEIKNGLTTFITFVACSWNLLKFLPVGKKTWFIRSLLKTILSNKTAYTNTAEHIRAKLYVQLIYGVKDYTQNSSGGDDTSKYCSKS